MDCVLILFQLPLERVKLEEKSFNKKEPDKLTKFLGDSFFKLDRHQNKDGGYKLLLDSKFMSKIK